MTPYAEGTKRTHVVVYLSHGNWRPLCNGTQAKITRFTKVKWTNDHPPQQPWCALCASKVAAMAKDVLGGP